MFTQMPVHHDRGKLGRTPKQEHGRTYALVCVPRHYVETQYKLQDGQTKTTLQRLGQGQEPRDYVLVCVKSQGKESLGKQISGSWGRQQRCGLIVKCTGKKMVLD